MNTEKQIEFIDKLENAKTRIDLEYIVNEIKEELKIDQGNYLSDLNRLMTNVICGYPLLKKEYSCDLLNYLIDVSEIEYIINDLKSDLRIDSSVEYDCNKVRKLIYEIQGNYFDHADYAVLAEMNKKYEN